jgi:hypothetical protein
MFVKKDKWEKIQIKNHGKSFNENFSNKLEKKTFEKNQKGNFEEIFLINLRKNYTENWNKNQNTKVLKKKKENFQIIFLNKLAK